MAQRQSRRGERLIYRAEMLDRAGCSYPTLLSDIRAGRLAPGRMIGGRTAWIESEVASYFKRLPRQRFRSVKLPAEGARP